jgi:hypothetical protein
MSGVRVRPRVGSSQQPDRVEIPEVESAISKQDFPATRDELAARLDDRGVGSAIVTVIRRLPEGDFASPADVTDAIRALDDEARTGGPRPVAEGAPGSAARPLIDRG